MRSCFLKGYTCPLSKAFACFFFIYQEALRNCFNVQLCQHEGNSGNHSFSWLNLVLPAGTDLLSPSTTRSAPSTMHTMVLCSDGTKPGSYWKDLFTRCMHAQSCASPVALHLRPSEVGNISYWRVIQIYQYAVCLIWCTINSEETFLLLRCAQMHKNTIMHVLISHYWIALFPTFLHFTNGEFTGTKEIKLYCSALFKFSNVFWHGFVKRWKMYPMYDWKWNHQSNWFSLWQCFFKGFHMQIQI